MKPEILSAENITKYLSDGCSGFEIEVLPITTSTNTDARNKADAGAAEGYVVIANAQTVGRGRRGRDFFSPDNTGLYMSMVLRPEKCPAEKAARITTMAAAAVCEAIEDVSGKDAGIKWVNDIFADGKKVCGILTEASFKNDGMLEYAILGIGINVFEPENGFPDELKGIAGAVFEEPENDEKNRIAASVLDHFMSYYKDFNEDDYIEAYRRKCFVIGKEIRILSPNSEKTAIAMDINDDCHLIVKYEDGTTEALASGEISIRI